MKYQTSLKYLVTLGVVLGLLGGVALSANATLLGDVNKALRAAGIAVTAGNQLGWAKGVAVGHYKNYQQLLDAMKYHKSLGKSVPDSSKFGQAVAALVSSGRTTCVNGEVASMSTKALSVKYKQGSSIVTKAFSFTQKQFDIAVGRSISTGSQVKVCTKNNRVVGNAINRAPKGLEATFGSTSSGGGGGGGGGS